MRAMVRYIRGRLPCILDQLPYRGSLRKRISDQGKYPAGHYYSPLPKHEEVLAHVESIKKDNVEFAGIHLDKEKQFELLKTFQAFYDDLPFPEEQSPNCRYYFDQIPFRYADAIFLYSFLRQTNPRKIVEVGSGFSSAVMLDTVERYFIQPRDYRGIYPTRGGYAPQDFFM